MTPLSSEKMRKLKLMIAYLPASQLQEVKSYVIGLNAVANPTKKKVRKKA